MPRRIQLSRQAGWRMPPNTVKVDRSTPYGNPFPVEKGRTPKQACDAFRLKVDSDSDFRRRIMTNLRGKNIGCWCAEDAEYCHGDILLEVANA